MHRKSRDGIQDRTFKAKDSYESFLSHFNIDKKAFLEWGISSTIFPPVSVEKDSNKNREPHKQIQALTGYRRNVDLFNYQVSHIWGHKKHFFI